MNHTKTGSKFEPRESKEKQITEGKQKVLNKCPDYEIVPSKPLHSFKMPFSTKKAADPKPPDHKQKN